MWPNPQETADLVTFTEEIIHGKLYFLCSVDNIWMFQNSREIRAVNLSLCMWYSLILLYKNENSRYEVLFLFNRKWYQGQKLWRE